MGIYSRFDFFLIERFAQRGSEAAGEYMAAYRFVDIITGIGFLFANILLPVFAKNISQRTSSRQTIDFYTLLFVGVGFLLSSFLYYYADELSTLLYAEGIAATSDSLSILAWSIPAIFITNVFGTYITAAQDIRAMLLISISASVLYLIVTISLLPSGGIMVTSWASMLMYWLLALVYVIYAYLGHGVYSQMWLGIMVMAVLSVLALYTVQLRWGLLVGIGLTSILAGGFALWVVRYYRPSS